MKSIDFYYSIILNQFSIDDRQFYLEKIACMNDVNTLYGFGCRVCFKENKFWLDYMSSGHGGFSIIKEITKHEYDNVRSGTVTFHDIIKSYPQKSGDVETSRTIENRWMALGI